MRSVWVAVVLCAAASSSEDPLPWWRTATLYEVYPRSFKDSNGDGIGDLKGIIQKADHLKELGVNAIWLTPIYKSPMVDVGYDISDFRGIDPTFGTISDFDALVNKCQQMGVKLLLDFVPNHTSDKHEWFQMSMDPTHPLHQDYRDFYVWLDSKGATADGQPIPPNNWVSLFGGSAWKWSEKRKQFYLHKFTVEQPDLNYFNPNVVGNMTDVLEFWIEKGVDGFRIDAVDHIFEDPTFPDEQANEGVMGSSYNWFQINHTATLNRPETIKLMEDWANFLYQRGLVRGRQLAMYLELYAPLEVSMKYYGTGKTSLKIPFNFLLVTRGNRFFRPIDIKTIIDQWMSSKPNDGVPNWVISNHDVDRIPNHFGTEMVDTMNMMTGTLPGVQVVYYGDEIGMEDTPVKWGEVVDPWVKIQGPYSFNGYTRDMHRTPMQWDDTVSAGFSTNATTWLPVNPNYWWLNVAAQRAAPVSHLKVFQALTKARQDPVLQKGDLSVVVPNDDTLVIIRRYNGSYYALISNLGDVPATYTSQMLASMGLTSDMKVVVSSGNSAILAGTRYQRGSLWISLKPKAAILLKSGSTQLLYSAVFLFVCTYISTFISVV